MEVSASVIIPFRDRGTDPLRRLNAIRVLEQWGRYEQHGVEVLVASDGREGDAQFNRHAAYNNGAAVAKADLLVFAESDMLIAWPQVHQALALAQQRPGMVVPFTEYRYMSEESSRDIRDTGVEPEFLIPESRMPFGRSIGAINVLHRETLRRAGRWDDTFEGNWYDDNAMERAFSRCCGATRWVDGPAFHLYHLPGWKGEHLTDADKAATARNKDRLRKYRLAATPQRIRELTAGGD